MSDNARLLRGFGKSDVKVSALEFGGHHLAVAKDEQTAVEIVHGAKKQVSPSTNLGSPKGTDVLPNGI